MVNSKLLFLGGSDIQIPALRRAHAMGYETILCDYLPDNPGRRICGKYFNASTTDFDEILSIAESEEVSGIIAYASDPAAPTAAYVAEKLGLPGNPLSGINTLSDKSKFRALLEAKEYYCPRYMSIHDPAQAANFIERYGKSIIKPVDSSGSKGISTVSNIYDCAYAFHKAMSFSRSGHVIIEEFIERQGPQMSGDVLVVEGAVIFSKYGDVHFDTNCNPLVPCSITIPSVHDSSIHNRIDRICEDIFKELEIVCGTFNVDVIVAECGEICIVEIGARNGGNLLTEAISAQTGYDLQGITLSNALSHPSKEDALSLYNQGPGAPAYAHYVIHSERDGIFRGIEYSNDIKKNIAYSSISISAGQEVNVFSGSNKRIGICLLRFGSIDEMHDKIRNIKSHIKIEYDIENE